jgi:hypothetical protein
VYLHKSIVQQKQNTPQPKTTNNPKPALKMVHPKE